MMIKSLALVLALALAAPAGAVTAKRPKVVGAVTALSGTKKLQVKVGKRLHALRKGEKLTLGRVVVVGRGVKATLRLKRPAGVVKGTELVQLTPGQGAQPKVTTTRRRGVITIKIAAR
jgi:alkylated DNA nucleotide flippase Atl1